MKKDNLKCVNVGEYGSYTFRLVFDEKRAVCFESYSDNSGFKPIGNRFFTLEQAEQIINALKEKPNLPLLIKRHKREMKQWQLNHPQPSI